MTELVIVTGVSGAGRTLAAQVFEEAGFYITDNIPLNIVEPYFKEIENNQEKYTKVALTVNHENAVQIFEIAKKHLNFNITFLGITCSEEVLKERYRVSGKVHPGQVHGFSLEDSIRKDIDAVRRMHEHFDVYIDTSKLGPSEFRGLIMDSCIGAKQKFTVHFFSFGYKISVPQDIETVFDVRCLPNPYWVPELRDKNGLDKPVRDYVLKSPETKEWLKNVIKYLNYYLENLAKNDHHHASIAIACSRGQHKSVVIAEYLAKYYSKKYNTTVSHRDLPKK